MSKLSVILLKTRNDYIFKQLCGSIREKSSRNICTTNGPQIERSGKTLSELRANSAKFCNSSSKDAFGKQILKPFSLTSQSYGLSFSTTSCLKESDKCRQKPLSNKVVDDCDDSKKVKDHEDCPDVKRNECPEHCKESTTSKSSKRKKKKRKKRKRKRKHRKRIRKHEDDCTDGEHRKKKEKHQKDVECDDSPPKAKKSWPVCKPRARRYRDPYKKEGTGSYFASLLKCGPKQCEILKKFLASFLLFCLASLALLFYFTDWIPWKKDEKPPEPVKKVKKVEVIEENLVVEKPKKQAKKPVEEVTKHIEVLDVECVCNDNDEVDVDGNDS